MDEKYLSLKQKLDSEGTFPMKYMFKFIVKKEKVHEVFPFFEIADISTKKSKTGKYTSITATIVAFTSDDIINKYLELDHLEGIISL